MQLVQVNAPKNFPNSYKAHDPNERLIYRVVQENWNTFLRQRELASGTLPKHIVREFESYLGCGVLTNGFMRLKCETCVHEKLVAFSCKRRGFCTSCGARRMSEQAAFLTDWILPEVPIRQWVLSFPMPLRFWMAKNSVLQTAILAIFIRAIAGYQKLKLRRLRIKKSETGTVTIKRQPRNTHRELTQKRPIPCISGTLNCSQYHAKSTV